MWSVYVTNSIWSTYRSRCSVNCRRHWVICSIVACCMCKTNKILTSFNWCNNVYFTYRCMHTHMHTHTYIWQDGANRLSINYNIIVLPYKIISICTSINHHLNYNVCNIQKTHLLQLLTPTRLASNSFFGFSSFLEKNSNSSISPATKY